MKMKGISFLYALVFLPSLAVAQVKVSEVMYDLAEGSDSGREWVEVFNEGATAVDLTEWKFFEGNTNHGITAVAGSELAPGVYAVIADNAAKFKTDWPNYSGLLFDSAFSLNNTGETLGLRCCGKELIDKDSVSYANTQGGGGDGNSLSRSGSSLVPTTPTPGAAPSAAQPAPTPEPEAQPAQETRKMPEPQPYVAPAPAAQEEKKAPAPEPISIARAEAAAPPPQPVTVKEEKPKAVAQPNTASPPKKKPEPQPEPKQEEYEEIPEEESREELAAAAVSAENSSSGLWFLGALAIAGCGAVVGYFVARKKKGEWEIIEES